MRIEGGLRSLGSIQFFRINIMSMNEGEIKRAQRVSPKENEKETDEDSEPFVERFLSIDDDKPVFADGVRGLIIAADSNDFPRLQSRKGFDVFERGRRDEAEFA